MDIISQETASSLRNIISRASKMAIVTHVHPDGDAIGSSTALLHFLEDNFQKQVRVIISDKYPQTLSFIVDDDARKKILVYEEDPAKAQEWLKESDTLFCLDFNAISRSGDLEESLKTHPGTKVLIDHHLNPDRQYFDLCLSETAISSASEYLYFILKALDAPAGIPISSLESIMAGVTTDTNNFANSVFPSTFLACSEIISAGIDRDAIVSHIYNEYRENRLRLMGKILKDLLVITPDGLAYVILSKEVCKEYDIEDGELEGFVNLPLAIKTVKMSAFLREEQGWFRVSLRSKRGISSNRCAMAHFNGGGHEQAAGGRLFWPKDISSPSEAADYIEKATKPFLNEN